MTPRAIRNIVARPQQPALFDEVTPPSGVPAEHLEAALEDLLNGWGLVAGTRFDGTDHYRTQTSALLKAAREALDDGVTPYEVLLLVVAPSFCGPDDQPLELIEVPE